MTEPITLILDFRFIKFLTTENTKGRSLIGYDYQHCLYQIQYEDGDKQELYHNKIHAHCNCMMSWKAASNNKNKVSTKSSPLIQTKKKKDI